MTELNELQNFSKIINLLEENYGKKLSDKIFRIWYEELKDYDREILKDAVIKCIKEYSYFPTINQVKEKMEFRSQYRWIWWIQNLNI